MIMNISQMKRNSKTRTDMKNIENNFMEIASYRTGR